MGCRNLSNTFEKIKELGKIIYPLSHNHLISQVFINFARQQTDKVEFKDNKPCKRSRALRKLRLRLGMLMSGRLGLNGDDTVRFASVPEVDDMNDENYEVTFSSNVSYREIVANIC